MSTNAHCATCFCWADTKCIPEPLLSHNGQQIDQGAKNLLQCLPLDGYISDLFAVFFFAHAVPSLHEKKNNRVYAQTELIFLPCVFLEKRHMNADFLELSPYHPPCTSGHVAHSRKSVRPSTFRFTYILQTRTSLRNSLL